MLWRSLNLLHDGVHGRVCAKVDGYSTRSRAAKLPRLTPTYLQFNDLVVQVIHIYLQANDYVTRNLCDKMLKILRIGKFPMPEFFLVPEFSLGQRKIFYRKVGGWSWRQNFLGPPRKKHL